MSNWTRRDAINLVITATKAGLTPEDAQEALEIGARLLAHGFTDDDINQMIRRYFADLFLTVEEVWCD